jgi:hypothetical protein
VNIEPYFIIGAIDGDDDNFATAVCEPFATSQLEAGHYGLVLADAARTIASAYADLHGGQMGAHLHEMMDILGKELDNPTAITKVTSPEDAS